MSPVSRFKVKKLAFITPLEHFTSSLKLTLKSYHIFQRLKEKLGSRLLVQLVSQE